MNIGMFVPPSVYFTREHRVNSWLTHHPVDSLQFWRPCVPVFGSKDRFYHRRKSWWTFRIFLIIFSARGCGKGSPRRWEGGWTTF